MVTAELRSYDVCFGEFLRPQFNGQKHMQAILVREVFARLQQAAPAVTHAPTVLDVSCGPGDYSVSWLRQLAPVADGGVAYVCTDYEGGRCADGTPYVAATVAKIQASADRGEVRLRAPPRGVEVDLFSDPARTLLPAADAADANAADGPRANIVHWSHSGYHVRDALGDRRDDTAAIDAALAIAVDKLYDALADEDGVILSVHQTNDVADGRPSQMLPVSAKFLHTLDTVPEYISRRVRQRGGFVARVHMVTPLYFPALTDAMWAQILDPAQWDSPSLTPEQRRTLRLFSFMLYDFSDPAQSGLEKLHALGTLRRYVETYRLLFAANAGDGGPRGTDVIYVKCAVQLACKSPALAKTLDAIASDLTARMRTFEEEMRATLVAESKRHGSNA